jgi:signal transduction histidine kinase
VAAEVHAVEPERGSRRFVPRSVRLRVTLAAAALVGLALAGASFALVRSVHDNLTDEIEETNQEQLELVAEQIRDGTAPELVAAPPNDGPGGPSRIRANGPGGRVQIPGAPNNQLPANRVARAEELIETASGRITLVAERSLTEVDTTVDNITDALVVGLPALVLLVGALGWWLTGRALRPVEAIRAEAAEITASTIHRRVPEPETRDEVGRLARTMNSMLDRLEESSLRQRRFVSDASHELRSPVASIRAQLEVAMRKGDAADWNAVAGRVLEEDARLEDAVAELLELARAEEGAALERVEVDLDEVVPEETQRERRVPVDTAKVSAGRVLGSATQLARAVRNLLDNACRHASTRVEVTLEHRDGSVCLTIDDDGPGVSPEDRDRVFDRFTRLDEGRARDAGGVGLGLSMVRVIVERHGGTVGVGDAPIGGARFTVALPLS